MSALPVLPARLVDELNSFVEKELRDCARYENREPYDDSSVYGLVGLLAQVYDEGHEDGRRMEAAIGRSERSIARTRAELAGGQS